MKNEDNGVDKANPAQEEKLKGSVDQELKHHQIDPITQASSEQEEDSVERTPWLPGRIDRD
jgi:hypothetical protein